MRILITGGAGYIGSFMTDRLIKDGHSAVVVDTLEEGHREAVNPKAEFRQGNLLDKDFLSNVFSSSTFDAVLHFAAYISMKESMEKPGKYFSNNIQAAVNLLDAMSQVGCKSFIFSSTAGVYGNPISLPIPEDHAKNPTNPYGESKYLVERMLPWYGKIYGIGSIALRYFNAAGGSLDGQLGEDHKHETHIIPNVIKAAITGQEFPLFGTDYDTFDGTNVRDYIHVIDLVTAHMLALEKLSSKNASCAFYNVGTGQGYSNRQIVEIVEKVVGTKVAISQMDRRPGDAATLVAKVDKIKEEFGFQTKYSDLQMIVETAFKWHKNRSVREQNKQK